MPRPRKDQLSDGVKVRGLRKRDNPDFVSSSFYVPKKINLRFDRALLSLKAEGVDVDRSDVLTVLMDRFATAVEDVEKRGFENFDMDSLVELAGGSVVVAETAGVSLLKRLMNENVTETKARVAELEDAHRQQLELYEERLKVLMKLIPEDVRGQLEASD